MRVPPSIKDPSTLYRLFCLYILLFFLLPSKVQLHAQCGQSVDAGEDIFLCENDGPQTIFLAGSVSGNPFFTEWSPASEVGNFLSLATTATITQTTSFTLTAAYPTTNNLVVNGDFEDGNVGFTSAYSFSQSSLYNEGVYSVIPNPNALHSNFAGCGDHTTGSGNMMVINGSGTADDPVWCQTIDVVPGTIYAFSVWIASVITTSPANLEFTINGVSLGSPIRASTTSCQWNSFFTLWEADDTSAEICVTNQNTAASGNDFALDDISFTEICEQSDIINVYFDDMELTLSEPDDLNCENSETELMATFSSPNGNDFLISWNTTDGNIIGDGFDANVIVDAPGTYTFTFFNFETGCLLEESVEVGGDNTVPFVDAGEEVEIDCLNTTVVLDGTGSDSGSELSFEWTTTDGNIVSDGGTLMPTVDAPGTYILTITNEENGCSETAEVSIVSIAALPAIEAIAEDNLDCVTASVLLNAIGSEEGDDITYAWTTDDGNIVSGDDSLMPEVDLAGTYTLVVTNTINGCTSLTDVVVTEDNLLPEHTINSTGVIDCETNNVLLEAIFTDNVDGDYSFLWTSTNGSFDSNTDEVSTTVDQAGSYTLVVTNNSNGCTLTTMISVSENLMMPNVQIEDAPFVDCITSEVILDASNTDQGDDFIYEWSTQDGILVSDTDGLNPSVDGTGTYQLIVTDTTNGCTNVAEITVTDNMELPIVTIATPDPLDCEITTMTLIASNEDPDGNYTYEWTTQDGNIVSDADGLSPTVDGIGTYQVIVTNTTNGCTNTEEVTVVESTDLPLVNIETPVSLDCQMTSTILNAINEDPNGSYNYEWSSTDGTILANGDTNMPQVEGIGVYTLIITNTENGCTSTTDVTVNENVEGPIINIEIPTDLNCLIQETSLSVNVDGDPNDFTFLWDSPDGQIVSGSTLSNPQVGAAGTYEVTVTDNNNGCTSTAFVLVNEVITEPFVDAGLPQMLTCDQESLNLLGESGLTANLIFEWTTMNGSIQSGETSLSPTVNAPGIYTLTVTDITNGCSSSDDVEVTQDLNAPISDAGPAFTLTCISEFYTLDGTNSSTGPEFIFEWSTEDGAFESDENTLTPTVNAPGTYQLTIINTANQCETISTVVIEEDVESPPLDGFIDFEHINCNNIAASLVFLTSQTLIASWSTIDGEFCGGIPADPGLVTACSAGTYTLTVENIINSCTSTLDVEVLENFDTPEIDAGPSATIDCGTSEIQLSGTDLNMLGNNLYNWITTDGNIISGVNTLTPTVNQAGSYTLIATHETSGCEASATVIVEQNEDLPQVNIEDPQMLNCDLLSLELDASLSSVGSEFIYSWSTDDGSISNGENTLNPEIASTGTYTLTIINTENLCESFASVTIEENLSVPTFDFAGPYFVNCEISTVQIFDQNDQGNFEYIWDSNDGSFTNEDTGITATAGTYSVTVLDPNNGCTSTAIIEVEADADIPEVEAGTAPAIDCNQSQIELSGMVANDNGNFIILWTTDDGNIISGENGLNPIVDQAGTYTLTVLNTESGCENTSFLVVEQNNDLPEINIETPEELNCEVLIVLLDASQSVDDDEFSYVWTTDDGAIITGENSLVAQTDMPGTYTLTISSSVSGCSSSETIVVGQNIVSPLAAPSKDGDLSCATQSVNLFSNSDGATGLTLEWSSLDGNIIGAVDTESIQVDQPGTYTLTIISEDNLCSNTFDILVEQDGIAPNVSILAPEQLTCNLETVTIDASASSTGNEFVYAWTTQNGNILNQADTETIEVDMEGIYELIITNTENGCSEVSTVAIFSNVELPTAIAGENQELNCLNTTLNLNGEGSSAGAMFQYQWTTADGNIISGENALNPLIDENGFYTLTVLNTENGCTNEAIVEVTESFETPVISIAEPALLTCINESSLLNFDITASIDNTFEWTTSDGNIIPGTENTIPEVDQPGTYTIFVTDFQSGCTSVAFVEVLQDIELPIVDAGNGIELTCNVTDYILNAAGSQGTNFEYSWTTVDGNILNNLSTLNPTIDAAGTYSLEITNTFNGCTALDEVIITRNENIPTGVDALVEPPLCAGDLGSIEIDFIEGGVGPYLYSIDGGQNYFNEDSFDLLPSGEYDLMIQDANGCEFLDQIEIPFVDPINVNLIPEVQLLFGESEQISSELINIEPTDIESILWTPAEGLSCTNCLDPVATPSNDITYTMTITTVNGCEASAEIIFRLDREIAVYIPNAFSPHDVDGINDIFQIFAKDGAVANIRSFQIYDRWGNKVFVDADFQPNDPNHGWDGNYRGERMNSGVFVYYAEIELIDGRIEIYKGDVTLME